MTLAFQSIITLTAVALFAVVAWPTRGTPNPMGERPLMVIGTGVLAIVVMLGVWL